MGMIIKDRLQQLMKGYPTVSDKYNVSGGILTGNKAVDFGVLVKRSGTPGYFEAISSGSGTTLADICGFVVATNVKLTENWPGTIVQVNPGEAFNLLVNGFIAIELDEDATDAQIISNAQVAVILDTGHLTTADKIDNSTIVALPNVVFTGIFEEQKGKTFAEIYVK